MTDTVTTADPLVKLESERWRDRLDHSKVPLHLWSGLIGYFVRRIQPGSFLTAVLENNLAGAVLQADDLSREGLFDLVNFLFQHAPIGSWGSPEYVELWLKEGRR